MPRSFSSGGSAMMRQQANLFAVHRIPEKEACCDEPPESMDMTDVDVLDSFVENLLENTDPASFFASPPTSATSPNSIPLPPALLLDEAKVWGDHNPAAPIEGMQPPCILSGPGANIATGVPMGVAAQAEEPAIPTTFEWDELSAPLITQDAFGVPVEQRALPAPGTNGLTCDVHLNPPFLFWAARRKWMWHRKWSLPTFTVTVQAKTPPPPGPGRALYVMLTAGTLRDDLPGLHDQGLGGQCSQARIVLDSAGHGTVTFSRLLFKHTSFHCGARPFHLILTIMQEPLPGMGAPTVAQGYVPLLSLKSCPVHVDARKRSKGERADAAPDDVRLVHRQNASRPKQATQEYRQAQHAQQQLQQLAQVQQLQAEAHARAQAQLHAMQQQVGQVCPPGPDAGLGFSSVSEWFNRILSNGGNGDNSSTSTTTPNQSPVPDRRANASPASPGGGVTTGPDGQPVPQEVGEAYLEVSAETGMIVNGLSPLAFGYKPADLLGQPLLAVCHPEDRAQLMQTLQVMLRMDEISRFMPSNGTDVGGKSQHSLRMLHRVVVGLMTDSPRAVPMDSIITLNATHKPKTFHVCSRTALVVGDHVEFQVRVINGP